jgi:ketosteroid isomerase-like protein
MICMLATMLALSVGCSAQAPRVIAQKLYDQWDQAYANRDLNHLLGFYDSGYVSTDVRGKRLAFAEFRKELEHEFAVYKRMNPRTTVEDVQLKAGRMVVCYKNEMRFEFHDRRLGWVPEVYKATGETTWERKGDQWKMIRSTTLRADAQVDPRWLEENKKDWETTQRVIECCDSNRRH